MKKWWSKVKEWWWVCLRVLNTDVRDLFWATKTITQQKTLSQLASESKALGLEELPILREIRQAKCEHDYVVETQVWTRIAPKKFELQNRLICRRCEDRIISAIQPR